MDVPDVALIMMRTFLYSGSFSSSLQNLHSAVSDEPMQCNCPVSYENDKDKYYEVGEDEMMRKMLKKETLKGGWLGAITGVAVTIIYITYRDNRRTSSTRSSVARDSVPLQVYHDEAENFSETELT